MPTTEQVVRTAIELDAKLAEQLRSELSALTTIRRQMSELKSAESTIASTVEDIRATIGEKTLSFEGAKITRVEPKDREKLDEMQLIRRFGLSIDDVNSCKVRTPVKPSTRITLTGEKEREY